MKINKNLMQRNHTALKRGAGDIKFIVIHYVGALGDAWENTEYYKTNDVGASADFWVGFDGEIWQGNDYLNYYSWAIGGGLQGDGPHPYFQVALNSNSVSIEMCVHKRNHNTMNATDRDWYFEDATVESAAWLTAHLMKELNIDIDHVIRHYDVNAKICPNPFVYNTGTTWSGFKDKVKGYYGEVNGAGDQSLPQIPDTLYRVQTGAFKDKKLAESFASTLKGQGFETCIKEAESLYKVQVGAFSMKANADTTLKKLQSYGYEGFVTGGDTAETKEMTVKVTTDVLNIRTGPGTGYTLSGQITDRGVYSIVETSRNWGKLKSGAGWICLDYTKNN